MGTLFRYELKKLLSRKIVWIALVLCLVSLIWYQWSYITDRTSGYVAGMRYAYSVFEGRTATNALREEVKEAQRQYIFAHPQDFHSFPSALVFLPASKTLMTPFSGPVQLRIGKRSKEDTKKN